MEWSQTELRDTAETIAEQSYVNPEYIGEGAWGAFSWGDAHPAIGGGIGAFQWFSSRDELLNYLSDHAITIWKDFDSEDEWKILQQSLKNILSSPSEDKYAVLDEFNELIKGYFQVEWLGTLDELVNSNDDFPKKVRSYFYENSNDDELESVEDECTEEIPANKRTEFSESLEQYGL